MKTKNIWHIVWLVACSVLCLSNNSLLGVPIPLPQEFQGTFSTLQVDFNNTFSSINVLQIQNTTNSAGTYSVLAADFGGTWSLITADANGTFSMLQTIINDNTGTFTVLGEIGSILGQGATVSATLLSIYNTVISDANGTFSAIQADFNNTWSLLGNVSCLGTGATITGTVCNIMQTINNDFQSTFTVLNADFQGTWSLITASSSTAGFQGTFTMLQNIINDQNGTFTALNTDFQGTWSLINSGSNANTASFQGTYTILQTIINDENGTFTVLGEVGSILGRSATISGTLLSIYSTMINDSNGTFSALQSDFNNTWSLLGNVSCLGTGATITGTLCNIMQTINSDFQGTWSLITAEANGTFSALAAGFNGTFSALNADFQGSYSMLQTIINDQNGTFSALNTDFQGTWSLLVADANGTFSSISAGFNSIITTINSDFQGSYSMLQTIINDENGTFTVLGNVGTILGQSATISGTLLSIYTTLVADANGTFSSIAAGFNGTFSTLNTDFQGSYSMLQTIINDANGTFSTLNTDFQGTWSLIVADGNGTFSALAAGFNGTFSTINADFQGTYSMLQTIINDANGTFSALNADFQGTWSLLVADFNSTWTLIAADFNGTWTMLGNVGTILGQGASISGTLLNIIETTTILYQNIASPVVINPSPFTTTYTISLPGRYIVPYNLTFTPAATQPAILITTTSVELDFLCSTFIQGNLVSGVNAVTVSNGLNDIYIHNAKIEHWTGAGIQVNFGCQFVSIEDSLTFSCDTSAIELLGTLTSSGAITESLIKNCSMLGCCQGVGGNVVLDMDYCIDVAVEDCILNGNGIVTNTLQGIYLNNGLKCTFNNVAVNDNIAGSDFRAYDIFQSTQCTFENCETKNCQCLATNKDGAARGFVMEVYSTATGNVFSNCVAMGLLASATVDGFLSATLCDDNIFLNCLSSLNTTTNLTGVTNGFQIVDNNRNELSECIAHYNSAPNYAAGFQINSCYSTAIERCASHAQNGGYGSIGVLAQVGGSPFSSNGSDATTIAFSPTTTTGLLFAIVSSDASNNATSYLVSQTTGAFALVSTVTANAPIGVAFSPIATTGNLFAAVINTGASAGISYLVNQATGALAFASNFSGGSGGVAFSPITTSGNLFAAAATASAVTSYSVNQSTGAFTTVNSYALAATPEGVAFSPITTSGNLFVAVAGPSTNLVTVYSVNQSSGVFTSVASFNPGNAPFELAFSPIVSGNLFLAVTNAFTNTVAVYSVNQSTGACTAVPNSPFATGSQPYGVAFSPLISGFLLAAVANNASGANTVSVYTVNTSTGKFTPVRGSPFATGTQPQTVAFSPLVDGNVFLATSNVNGGGASTISVFLAASSGSTGFWSFQNSGGAATGCVFKENEAINNGFGFRLDLSPTGSITDTAFIRNIAMKNATNFNTTFPSGAIQTGNTNQLNGASFATQPWVNIGVS